MGLEPTTLSLGIPPSDCATPCPSGAKREVGNALHGIEPCPRGPSWARSCRRNGMKNGLYAWPVDSPCEAQLQGQCGALARAYGLPKTPHAST